MAGAAGKACWEEPGGLDREAPPLSSGYYHGGFPAWHPDAVDQPCSHYRNEMGIWTSLQSDNAEAVGPAGMVHISIAGCAKFVAFRFSSQTPAILDRAVLDDMRVPDSGDCTAGLLMLQRQGAGGPAMANEQPSDLREAEANSTHIGDLPQ